MLIIVIRKVDNIISESQTLQMCYCVQPLLWWVYKDAICMYQCVPNGANYMQDKVGSCTVTAQHTVFGVYSKFVV